MFQMKYLISSNQLHIFQVLEALAVVKLQNASSELKDLDKVVPDIARSRAAKLRQTYDQIDSIEVYAFDLTAICYHI